MTQYRQAMQQLAKARAGRRKATAQELERLRRIRDELAKKEQRQ